MNQELFSLQGLIEIENPDLPDMSFFLVPVSLDEKRIESYVRMEILPEDLQAKIRKFVRAKNKK